MNALILALLPAWAGDPGLEFTVTALEGGGADPPWGFGIEAVGGDLDDDGFGDLVVAASRELDVFYGGPLGLSPTADVRMPVRYQRGEDAVGFGQSLELVDFDGDGRFGVVVGAPEGAGGLYYYEPSFSGFAQDSEQFHGTWAWESIGYDLSAGDLDGDGKEELLAGSPHASTSDGASPGLVHLFHGSEPDPLYCSNESIPLPSDFSNGDKTFHDFGFAVSLNSDTNGDGYQDAAITCPNCLMDCQEGCGSVFVWFGGTDPSFEAADAWHDTYLYPYGDGHSSGTFGWSLAGADLGADGYDELIVGAIGGPHIYPGSPAGPATELRVIPDASGTQVAATGDVDGDGYDDLLAGTGGGGAHFTLLFGGPGPEAASEGVILELATPMAGYGSAMAGIGDVDGDARPELILGASELAHGRAYVYSPTCTRFADADDDGAGDPATRVQGACRQTDGYVPHGDDCDDQDSTVQGAAWYLDADGDQTGTGPPILACAAPGGTVAWNHDCDDDDPRRHPYAVDPDVDGVDQDCDGHDGAWDTGVPDCEDTADSGDTADTSAEPAPPSPDTGDTADGERPPPLPPTYSSCDCSAGSAGNAAIAAALGVLVAAPRRRR